ncbi:MAG TPA: hypothetical protein VJ866_08505 [Pyrinomonadaceae bacterium]|nr:hypothetical protein [Pyrinomonadaceae bacterium]
MRKVFVSLLCLLFLSAALSLDASAQDRRRHRSRFGRKARTAAMLAGGAAVGGLIGGKKGAAIGALAGGGGSALYTYKLRKRNRNY